MFAYGLPKTAAHADDRLAERTNLDPSVLRSLRSDLNAAAVPYGTHHVALEDGSYAVLKDISRGGKKRHVVATVLSSDMSPPGTDVTREFASSGSGRLAYLSGSRGPNVKDDKGVRVRKSKHEIDRRFGSSRRERLRNALKRTQQTGHENFKRLPGGFQSSRSYSFSTEKRASIIGAATGAYYAGGDTKNRAKGAAGGAVGGQIAGWAGTGAGLYAAHKLGYTKALTKGRSPMETAKYVARHPLKTTSKIGLKGTSLIVGGSVLGSALGGIAGAHPFKERNRK